MGGGGKFSITNICKHRFFKHMPRVTFLFLVIIMVACPQTPSWGRGGSHSWKGGKTSSPPCTSEELLARMKDRLNLTDEQQVKVRPIIEEYWQKWLDIIEKYKGHSSPGGECCLRSELQRLWESTEKQLATVLTDKQIKKYQRTQGELQPKPPERIE
jgi:hypothetical protein